MRALRRNARHRRPVELTVIALAQADILDDGDLAVSKSDFSRFHGAAQIGGEDGRNVVVTPARSQFQSLRPSQG
ncbi:MAG: hypothetical protein U0075_04890 [Thermomicrobiales bacterium]